MDMEISRVTDYYNQLHVAVLKLREPLKVDDLIYILEHSTDFIQKVTSLQINHHNVAKMNPANNIALKVIELVREHG